MRWSTCALDRGANFCDTANVYSGGRSEEVLGEVLGDRRRGIEASSRRLGTDYLDIHYLHLPDYDVAMEESFATLEELRVEGLIRYPATSNYSAWQMCEMFAIREREGWAKPWIAQPMYNLAARGIELENLAAFEAPPLSAEVLAGCEAVWARLRGPTPNYNR